MAMSMTIPRKAKPANMNVAAPGTTNMVSQPIVNKPVTQAPQPQVSVSTTAPNLSALQAQRAQLQTEVGRRTGAKQQGFKTQLSDVTQQIRNIRNPQAPVPPTPEMSPPLTVEGQPPVQAPVAAPNTSPTGQMKTAYDFMPKNIEESPGFQYQKDKGQKDLARLLAARGFTGSGKELGANAELINQLYGKEYDRALNTATLEADRNERYTFDAANRDETKARDQWGMTRDVLDLATKQNPMEYAYSGAEKYADTKLGKGKTKAGYTKDAYGRVIANPGGGGGGTAPVYAPPFAAGPDMTLPNMLQPGQDASNIGGWANTILKGLPSIANWFG